MNKKLFALFILSVLFFSPIVVRALDIGGTLDNIVTYVLFPVFFGSSVIMTLWAGILFMTAAGDPGKIQTAKKAFMWAAVGMLVGLLSYAILEFIQSLIAF